MNPGANVLNYDTNPYYSWASSTFCCATSWLTPKYNNFGLGEMKANSSISKNKYRVYPIRLPILIDRLTNAYKIIANLIRQELAPQINKLINQTDS